MSLLFNALDLVGNKIIVNNYFPYTPLTRPPKRRNHAQSFTTLLKASHLIDITDVRERVPVSRRTLYALMSRAGFPRPCRIPGRGPRVWWEPAAVDAWAKANGYGAKA